jgi:hypothetical protein
VQCVKRAVLFAVGEATFASIANRIQKVRLTAYMLTPPQEGDSNMDSEIRMGFEIKSKELMFEYDQLRKEILQNDALAIQISGGVFLIVSALMGFALTREGVDNLIKGSLFIVAVVVAIYGLFQTTWRVRNTRLIASYLRVHIEPQTSHLRWETRLFHYIRDPQKGRGMHLLTNQGYIYTPLIVLNYLLACHFLELALRPDVSDGVLTILFAFGLFMISYTIIVIWPGRGLLSYESIWRGKDLPHRETFAGKLLAWIRARRQGSRGRLRSGGRPG